MAFDPARPVWIKLVCPICFDFGYTQTSKFAATVYPESSGPTTRQSLSDEERKNIPVAIEQLIPISNPFVQCNPVVSSEDSSKLLYTYTLIVNSKVLEPDVVSLLQGRGTTSREAFIGAFQKAQLLKNRRIPFAYWLKQSCATSPVEDTHNRPCVIIRRELHTYLLETSNDYEANQSALQRRGYVTLGDGPINFYIGYVPESGPPSAAEWSHAALDAFGWTIEGFLAEEIPHPFRQPWSPNDGLCIGQRQQVSGDNGSDAAFQVVIGWLQDCIGSHAECLSTEESALPDRVIDIGLPNDPVPRLRLVSGKGMMGKYACLSHRWGPETHTTTRWSINEHLRGIRWDTLSETFQDAITFLRKLSAWHNSYRGSPIRYIWIDSLCIIQDSDGDWHEQSQKMCEVYSNAFITFLEGYSRGRDKRLFSKVSENRTAKAIPITDAEGRTREFYLRYPISHPVFQKSGTDAPIWTRGWVFQERLLSPRLLVFGSDELSWTCSGCSKCECGIDEHFMDYYKGMTTWPIPEIGVLYPVNLRNMNLLLGKTPSKSQLCMVWRLILESYSQLQLTYRKDTLAALAGLARSFDKRLGGRKYCAGFWIEESDASPPPRQKETIFDLLWRLKYSQDGRRANPPDSPVSQSWSWAKPQCSIVYPFVRDKLITTYSAVASFRAVPPVAGAHNDSYRHGTLRNDMYTDITPTMLVMAGPLFRTQLREVRHFFKLAETEQQEYSYFLGDISDLNQHSAAVGHSIEIKLSLVSPPGSYNWDSDDSPATSAPPIVFYPDNQREAFSEDIYILPAATFLHVPTKGKRTGRKIFVALVLEQVGHLEATDVPTPDPATVDTGSLVFRRLGLAYTMDHSWDDNLDKLIWDRCQLSAVRII